MVGEATTNTLALETDQSEAKQDSNENAGAEAEEVEEEIPPRKKLRLEKKLRNAEFLFRRRKRDICSKMRQYESEYNQTTRQNNALQLQVRINALNSRSISKDKIRGTLDRQISTSISIFNFSVE